MESTTPSVTNRGLVAAAVILAAGLAGAAGLRAHATLQETAAQRNLSVQGHAKRQIRSTHMKWSVTVERQNPSATGTAQTIETIKRDFDRLEAAIRAAGVDDLRVSRQPAQNRPFCTYSDMKQTCPSGSVAQTSVIESDRLDALNGQTATLIASLQGDPAAYVTQTTEFTYPDQDRLREELVREAVEDARAQAKRLLAGNERLGKTLMMDTDSAAWLNVGPVATAPGSMDYGNANTSIDKDATISVRMTFAIK